MSHPSTMGFMEEEGDGAKGAALLHRARRPVFVPGSGAFLLPAAAGTGPVAPPTLWLASVAKPRQAPLLAAANPVFVLSSRPEGETEAKSPSTWLRAGRVVKAVGRWTVGR